MQGIKGIGSHGYMSDVYALHKDGSMSGDKDYKDLGNLAAF